MSLFCYRKKLISFYKMYRSTHYIIEMLGDMSVDKDLAVFNAQEIRCNWHSHLDIEGILIGFGCHTTI